MTAKFSAQRTLLAIFIFVAIELFLAFFVDRPLSIYLRKVDIDHHSLIDFFRAYTDYAKGVWYLVPSGIGLLLCLGIWYAKGKKSEKLLQVACKFGFFFACVILSGLAVIVIKRIVGRARPVLLEREDLYRFSPLNFAYNYNSWPSGHTTTAFAVAGALAILWPRGRPAFFFYALFMAACRIMVNAHYFSDVLAGAVVGLLTVLATHEWFRRRGLPFNSHE